MEHLIAPPGPDLPSCQLRDQDLSPPALGSHWPTLSRYVFPGHASFEHPLQHPEVSFKPRLLSLPFSSSASSMTTDTFISAAQFRRMAMFSTLSEAVACHVLATVSTDVHRSECVLHSRSIRRHSPLSTRSELQRLVSHPELITTKLFSSKNWMLFSPCLLVNAPFSARNGVTLGSVLCLFLTAVLRKGCPSSHSSFRIESRPCVRIQLLKSSLCAWPSRRARASAPHVA